MHKSVPTLDRADFITTYLRILDENGLADFATEVLANRFFALTARLLAGNAVMNLTAITDPHEIILKHYVDSLCAAKYLPQDKTVADVGCGAGFPTLPLALVRPDLRLTAIDSTDKRIAFVRETAAALGLENVTAVTARAEDAGAGEMRGKYDCVTARAVARLNMLCEFCIPLLHTGGLFLPMKAKNGTEELNEAKNAIRTLHAELRFCAEFRILDTGSVEPPQSRMIAGIEKIGETEKIYPRNFSQIKKKPL